MQVQKIIKEKFQPQPEQGHQVSQEEGEGHGHHAQVCVGRIEGAIAPIFYDFHPEIFV